MTPKVSVIVNCFNGELFLRDCLKSIFDQTYENWEIIFVNNASTDESLAVTQSYVSEKIKIINLLENISLVEARMIAIGAAHGDYISFLDVDDLWHPRRIEEFIKLAVRKNAKFIYSNTYFFNDIKRYKIYKKIMPSGWITNKLIPKYFISLEAIMIHREILSEIKINKFMKYTYDLDLVLKASTLTEFYYLNEALSYWRMHESSATNKNRIPFVIERWNWCQSEFAKSNIRKYNLLLYKLRLIFEYVYFKYLSK